MANKVVRLPETRVTEVCISIGLQVAHKTGADLQRQMEWLTGEITEKLADLYPLTGIEWGVADTNTSVQ